MTNIQNALPDPYRVFSGFKQLDFGGFIETSFDGTISLIKL
jgi:hypothetical protein